MLTKHLDESAKSKLVGCESNYEESMERLTKFYGNNQKVVTCVMKDVNKSRIISDGDYKGLIAYSVLLEVNYNRLKSIKREFEMSNTSTMTSVIGKLPRLIGEKWNEHLSQQSSEVKDLPFNELIVWMVSQREMWEGMVVHQVETKKTDPRSSFYADGSKESEPTCFRCGEVGHKQWNCSKKKEDKRTSKKPRNPPQVKKFWCAFHKGDKSKRCWSNVCQDLRKMTDANLRVKYLKENGDCHHCCGDHKPSDCKYKERVCGGGKVGHGCSSQHKLHELFCVAAKVCMAVSIVKTMSCNGDKEEGVVLLIMNVRMPNKKFTASVFWDYGSNANFVRDAFAKESGFRGRQDVLSVTTLGGTVTEYKTVTTYTCSIRDINGQIHSFEAYGLDSITGSITKINSQILHKLFPRLSWERINDMTRSNVVDFLIGILHPSWHPEKTVRASGGGDCWLFEGLFGSCVGGRHPKITERTLKSEEVFHVNHIYTTEKPHTTPHFS